MSDPTNEPQPRLPEGKPVSRAGVTPLRLVVWFLGGALAIALIVTGVVGILTKAR
jgi:hypothetical protein